jgi:hypothetical protein
VSPVLAGAADLAGNVAALLAIVVPLLRVQAVLRARHRASEHRRGPRR